MIDGRTAATPPIVVGVVYVFAPDRKVERPAAHLEHFKGVPHVDGYAGVRASDPPVATAFSLRVGRTRRNLYDVA